MITKKLGVDFFVEEEQKKFFSAAAYTLNPEEVLENHNRETGTFVRVHPDGWIISGRIVEDYYYWVNDFEAIHPVYGRVWGNFEEEVYVDTEEGFQDFMNKHEPHAWDYYDI
jgi:hypothetical protein